jgi:hypothetical protein
MVGVQGHSNLLQLVATLHPSGCLAGRLHRRQQQCQKQRDDGDHHQKLHEGETV